MKKFLIAAFVLVSGCAHMPVGETSTYDTKCGDVSGIEVRLREDTAFFTCQEASAAVARYAPSLQEKWTVIFTPGNPGIDVRRGAVVFPGGVTYPENNLIVVRTTSLWALKRQLADARAIELTRK
jgi:hypothetical protein